VRNEQKEIYYCGPFGSSEIVRKQLSKVFNEECKTHDEDYNNLLMTRKEADKRFYKNMKKRAGYWPINRLLAWLFYIGVRKGGEKYWRIAQLEAINKNEV